MPGKRGFYVGLPSTPGNIQPCASKHCVAAFRSKPAHRSRLKASGSTRNSLAPSTRVPREQSLTLGQGTHHSSSAHIARDFFAAPARLRLPPAPSLFGAARAAGHRFYSAARAQPVWTRAIRARRAHRTRRAKCVSWCSKRPFSRQQACSAAPARPWVWCKASRHWAALQDWAGSSLGSSAAGAATGALTFDRAHHFLSVPADMFSSSAISHTLRVPRCRTLLRACSRNSSEC
jgi:hypothetical protein